jgi:acyl-CoA thioesterase-1
VFVVATRVVRVRLSVAARKRYWDDRAGGGDLRIVALGDSLTQGIGSSGPSTSWLGSFAAWWEERTGRIAAVDNRAVYGAKVHDVLISQLPVPADSDVVTLCVGANDSGRTQPEQFRQDLREICRQLPKGSFVGDVPEFQWGPRIAAAAELSAIVRSVVAEHPGLILAEVERHTADTRLLTDLAGDFFHPGDRGYRRIAAAFIEAAALSPVAGARAGTT